MSHALAPRAAGDEDPHALRPCLGPQRDCLLNSGGVPGHVGLQAAIWPRVEAPRKWLLGLTAEGIHRRLPTVARRAPGTLLN